MLGKIGEISKMTHPTRRGFLQMIGASILPKPPIDFGHVLDVSGTVLSDINLEEIYKGTIDTVFHTRLGLKGEARRTFLKRLNAALAEKGFPVFGEIDLDNQELGPERRKIVTQGLYDSVQQKLREDEYISFLRDIIIPGAENQRLQVGVSQGELVEIIRNFGTTGNIPNEARLGVKSKISFSIGTESVEVSIFDGKGVLMVFNRDEVDERIFVHKGSDFIFLTGKKGEYILEIPGNLDTVRDFLRKPASEISEIIRKDGVSWSKIWENRGYEIHEHENIDEENTKEVPEKNPYKFKNSTALTPIAHIKNRVYDVTQNAPQDFPLSFAVQKVLGEMEFDVEVLLREFQNA